ncbi:DUF2232 domain-containing protein [Azorhizobium doebereinerae]|uniref:DUF2232 domain-containing protein n=1 Tax=Azorhizobium doebereinerae TaxID=281091 RepID=UPI00040BE9D5|nr:DUF2232 domain-containing protein [Azorhizobium doebereinerae]
MGPFLLIGIAAGAASALLVAGVAAGSVLAVPLFYLAPLPLMIGGLAFSHISAAVGVVAASLGLGFMYGTTFLIAYLMGIGIPAWVLAYCALLARQDANARDGITWFPVGGLMVVGAGLATLSVVVALFSLAGSYEAYRDAVVQAFQAFVKIQGASPMGGSAGADPAAMGETVAIILPPTAAALMLATQLGCLYLAARAARLSGRLARPWPDLAATRLPSATSLALAVLIAIAMMPGLVGLSAAAAGAALIVCYTAVGFAVLHFLTRGRAARPFILTGAWVLTLAIGWPALVVALLGVADAMFDLRRRIGTGGGPPAANDR